MKASNSSSPTNLQDAKDISALHGRRFERSPVLSVLEALTVFDRLNGRAPTWLPRNPTCPGRSTYGSLAGSDGSSLSLSVCKASHNVENISAPASRLSCFKAAHKRKQREA